MGVSTARSIFKDIWATSCRFRHKIFFWLLLHDKNNTRNMLQRMTMHLDSYSCVLCSDKTDETSIHLFWNCPFSLYCWDHIIPNRKKGISAFDEIQLATSLLPKDFALDIMLMGCWGIWCVRNNKIFKADVVHIEGWKYYLKEGLWACQIRVKQKKTE